MPWDEDAEGYQSSVMVRATNLANAAAVAFTLAEARKLYTDFGNTPPPVPVNAGQLAPCAILITERHKSGTGERIGRIQFLPPDGNEAPEGGPAFDQIWQVSGSA